MAAGFIYSPAKKRVHGHHRTAAGNSKDVIPQINADREKSLASSSSSSHYHETSTNDDERSSMIMDSLYTVETKCHLPYGLDNTYHHHLHIIEKIQLLFLHSIID